jgi:hypothetical protein
MKHRVEYPLLKGTVILWGGSAVGVQATYEYTDEDGTKIYTCRAMDGRETVFTPQEIQSMTWDLIPGHSAIQFRQRPSTQPTVPVKRWSEARVALVGSLIGSLVGLVIVATFIYSSSR